MVSIMIPIRIGHRVSSIVCNQNERSNFPGIVQIASDFECGQNDMGSCSCAHSCDAGCLTYIFLGELMHGVGKIS